MKAMVFGLLLLNAQASVGMVSCQINEGDGATASAETEIKAKKAAWMKCIDKKVTMRERRGGEVTMDAADYDAESCMNAKISCR